MAEYLASCRKACFVPRLRADEFDHSGRFRRTEDRRGQNLCRAPPPGGRREFISGARPSSSQGLRALRVERESLREAQEREPKSWAFQSETAWAEVLALPPGPVSLEKLLNFSVPCFSLIPLLTELSRVNDERI